MTDRELMQQSLEALEEISGGYSQNLIAALRERLAQPEQETVMAEYKFQTYAAYKTPDGEMKIGVVPDDAPLTLNGVPLYPRREWVGLTDEEVVDLKMLGRDLEFVSMTALRRFARDIEAKLREKNNG